VNITDAAYAVAHEYPGGTESLGPRVGLSAALLRNKVNPNQSINHLTLAEAVRISVITGDQRIVQAFARELGLVCLEVPEAENCADADVIELMAKTWDTHGAIGREVNETFADGRVEQHEVKRVRDRAWDHIRTLFGLIGRIEGMAEK
jgi:hypothetical protein